MIPMHLDWAHTGGRWASVEHIMLVYSPSFSKSHLVYKEVGHKPPQVEFPIFVATVL
jgi:hypothetical protein